MENATGLVTFEQMRLNSTWGRVAFQSANYVGQIHIKINL